MGRPFNMSPTVYGAVISASIHLPRHYRAHGLLATTNCTMKIKKNQVYHDALLSATHIWHQECSNAGPKKLVLFFADAIRQSTVNGVTFVIVPMNFVVHYALITHICIM
jgi:hypothetical protein